jgi:hypothetical protein
LLNTVYTGRSYQQRENNYRLGHESVLAQGYVLFMLANDPIVQPTHGCSTATLSVGQVELLTYKPLCGFVHYKDKKSLKRLYNV